MKFDRIAAAGYSGQEAEAILAWLVEAEIWITPIWEVKLKIYLIGILRCLRH